MKRSKGEKRYSCYICVAEWRYHNSDSYWFYCINHSPTSLYSLDSLDSLNLLDSFDWRLVMKGWTVSQHVQIHYNVGSCVGDVILRDVTMTSWPLIGQITSKIFLFSCNSVLIERLDRIEISIHCRTLSRKNHNWYRILIVWVVYVCVHLSVYMYVVCELICVWVCVSVCVCVCMRVRNVL